LKNGICSRKIVRGGIRLKRFISPLILALIAVVLHWGPSQAAARSDARWDDYAKKVRYTVPQEKKIKEILEWERENILECRAKASERIFRVLDPQQKKKWDELYRRADKQGGYLGEAKKRQLLEPGFLKVSFTLKPEQSRQLFYIYWDYSRQVNNVRKKAAARMGRFMSRDQMRSWYEAVSLRLEQERAHADKLLLKQEEAAQKEQPEEPGDGENKEDKPGKEEPKGK
jgi:hypothetical protein